MADVIGRLYETATSMDGHHPPLDEPLVINDSEVEHVATYIKKLEGPLKKGSLTAEDVARIIRGGGANMFGKKIKVLS